jgi:hypothetical protein
VRRRKPAMSHTDFILFHESRAKPLSEAFEQNTSSLPADKEYPEPEVK